MPRAAKPLARPMGRKTLKRQKCRSVPLNIDFIGATSSSYNRYDELSSVEDMDEPYESNINTVESPYKPPPIVTDINVPLREIQHLLGNDCIFKRTSIGVKVFPQTKDKFKFCVEALKEAKIEFHTFNAKEDKLYTTFIYGLPRIKTDDIIAELRTYNLSPTSVEEVKTRYSSENDAVYRVKFACKSFTPSSLNSIKAISNVIITWRKQRPKNGNKPTQCWNCLMYGHGGQHCNRKPACMTCANHHPTKDCPFTQHNKKPAVFTCFNCRKQGYERTDHSANDVNCPLRSHYLEVRAKVTAAPRNRNTRPQRNNNNHMSTPAAPARHTAIGNASQQRGNSSYAGVTRNMNSDLFDIDELFNIFSSALDELSHCTTKIQQIQVIMSLIKYAHDIR